MNYLYIHIGASSMHQQLYIKENIGLQMNIFRLVAQTGSFVRRFSKHENAIILVSEQIK